MSSYLERMCVEAVMVSSRYQPSIFIKGLRKTTQDWVLLPSLWAKMLTQILTYSKMNSDRNSSLYCNDSGLKSGFQTQDLLKTWFEVYHYILIIKRM